MERILWTEAHPDAERLAGGCGKLQRCREDIRHVQTSWQYRCLARGACWGVLARLADWSCVRLPDRKSDESPPWRWPVNHDPGCLPLSVAKHDFRHEGLKPIWLFSQVLVGSWRCVYQATERCTFQGFSVSNHLRQHRHKWSPPRFFPVWEVSIWLRLLW